MEWYTCGAQVNSWQQNNVSEMDSKHMTVPCFIIVRECVIGCNSVAHWCVFRSTTQLYCTDDTAAAVRLMAAHIKLTSEIHLFDLIVWFVGSKKNMKCCLILKNNKSEWIRCEGLDSRTPEMFMVLIIMSRKSTEGKRQAGSVLFSAALCWSDTVFTAWTTK